MHATPAGRARPTTTTTRLAAVLVALLALLLGACGDDGGAAGASPTPAPASSAASSGTGGEAQPTRAPDVKPFKLRIGVVSTTRTVSGPLGWGDEQGILLEHLAPLGVTDVELLIFGTGPPLIAALQNGDVDMVSTGDVPAMAAAANGLSSRLIQFSAMRSDTWLIGQPDGPRDLAGLVGKVVTAPPGTSPERFVRGLIARAGLGDAIEITNLATPDAVSALRGGRADAIPVGGVQAARLQREGYQVLARARDIPELASTSTIVALEEFLDAHPGFVAAFGEAWSATVASIAADFDAYLDWYADVEEEPVELIREVTYLDSYPTEPFPDEAVTSLEQTAQFLLDTGVIDAPFPVDDWIARD